MPNVTTKIVAGVIDGNELIRLFSAPEHSQDGRKVTILNKSEQRAHFLSVVPSQTSKTVSHTRGKVHEETILRQGNQTRPEGSAESSVEQHFSYVLQSTLIQKTDERSKV